MAAMNHQARMWLLQMRDDYSSDWLPPPPPAAPIPPRPAEAPRHDLADFRARYASVADALSVAVDAYRTSVGNSRALPSDADLQRLVASLGFTGPRGGPIGLPVIRRILISFGIAAVEDTLR